jgi:hypothetical protein
MKRHTPCARGPHGRITQTDGRFWAVHPLFVAFVVPAGVWLPPREHPRTRPRSVDARRRAAADLGGVCSMRTSVGSMLLILALCGCHSKTRATADLLASLDTELSRTEVEVQKCLRALDERSDSLARKLSLLHDTHQRTMVRNYANVVPLVRAEAHARKSFDAFFNQSRRCQVLESHGIALRERLVATITVNDGSVPKAWLERSTWFEKDLVAAKSRASDLTDKVTTLLRQADSEFDQVNVFRGRGCVILGNCGAIQQADALIAAEGETGTVAPLSARGR